MNGNFCTVEMMIFLPLFDELAQVARVLGMSHGRAHLRELLDGVSGSACRECAGR